MYIWVILAMIMVSLSLLNKPVRPEKDKDFVNIKASSFVNRFMLEHAAFINAHTCEVVNRVDDTYIGYDGSNELLRYGYISDGSTNENEQTRLNRNLPLGYIGDVDNQIYHYTFCLDKPLSDTSGTTNLVNCTDSSHYRYGISYAQVPDEWLSKQITTTSVNGSDVSYHVPTPSLLNFLSDNAVTTTRMGWTQCYTISGTDYCKLSGRKSTEIRAVDGAASVKNIDIPSVIRNSDPEYGHKFSYYCNSETPCLFAFKEFLLSDHLDKCRTSSGD